MFQTKPKAGARPSSSYIVELISKLALWLSRHTAPDAWRNVRAGDLGATTALIQASVNNA